MLLLNLVAPVSFRAMPAGKTILVVEDEADLADLVAFNLEREGYRCRIARDGNAALAELDRDLPDLIVLDRMLPGASGDTVLARLRRKSAGASLPVIMLTAKADESDELVGFALGADDYLTKPFSVKRLVARVGAVLRRRGDVEPEPASLRGGPIQLDPGRREVRVDGVAVSTTATEFKLLRALMTASGRVLSRDQLIDTVLGHGVAVTDRTIDVHVAALRKKLGMASGWVTTIRGAGYAFRSPADGGA